MVIPGDQQPPVVHALAHAINEALGSVGKTVIYTDSLEMHPVDEVASLRQLVNDMRAGQVDTLLILGGNPAYDAPADLDFAGAVSSVKTVLHVSQHANETSALCNWHVPERHCLEDWSDTRAFDGTRSILQPLIEPLYDSHSIASVLDVVLQFPARDSYPIRARILDVAAQWERLRIVVAKGRA